MKLIESKNLLHRAKRLIPGASQTNSKSYVNFAKGAYPVFIRRGLGSHVWDIDGNEYIDYASALGPNILGYAYPTVNRAVRDQLKDGSIYTLPHPLEVEVAEILVDLIPCAEMVRFGKNGSDVTTAAIRLARAATGRDIVACCGYHGWHDWYIGTTEDRHLGVPKAVKSLTKTFKYNDIRSLENIFDEFHGKVAAVILEPIILEYPIDGFLEKVQKLSYRNGSVLIFDEIITGFRINIGGAQKVFGVVPDIACFSKAIANGFPLSALVGKRELMKQLDKVFFSFTFGGDAIGLAAAKATLSILRTKFALEHIHNLSNMLSDRLTDAVFEHNLEDQIKISGYPGRFSLLFNGFDEKRKGLDANVLKSNFQREAAKRGILFTGSHMISYSHKTKDIDVTAQVYSSIFEKMRLIFER